MTRSGADVHAFLASLSQYPQENNSPIRAADALYGSAALVPDVVDEASKEFYAAIRRAMAKGKRGISGRVCESIGYFPELANRLRAVGYTVWTDKDPGVAPGDFAVTWYTSAPQHSL